MKLILLAATPKEVPGELTELCGCPIHYTGIGKTSAAIKSTEVILMDKPDMIINFGSCGAIDNIEVGRLLKVGTVCNDIDTHPFAPYGKTPYSDFEDIHLSNGNTVCLTADRFYDKFRNDYSIPYYEKIMTDCSIVDMELYAIAQSCVEYGVPLLSWKWVSDSGTPHEWSDNRQKGFDTFTKTLQKFITNNEYGNS